MKLRFLGIAILFLVAQHNGFSQNVDGVYFAIKGGFNLSSMNSKQGEGNYELQTIKGFSVSGVLSFPLAKGVGMSIEPGYTLKGAEIDNADLDYKFNYWGGPILFDYFLNNRVKISAGPEILRLSKAYNHTSEGNRVNIGGAYSNDWEFSGTLGISYSVDFFMDLGLRYNKAFTNISDYDPILDQSNKKNQYVQFFLLLKIAN